MHSKITFTFLLSSSQVCIYLPYLSCSKVTIAFLLSTSQVHVQESFFILFSVLQMADQQLNQINYYFDECQNSSAFSWFHFPQHCSLTSPSFSPPGPDTSANHIHRWLCPTQGANFSTSHLPPSAATRGERLVDFSATPHPLPASQPPPAL